MYNGGMAKRPLAILFTSLLFLYFPAETAARHLTGFQITSGEIFISVILPLFVLVGLLRVTRIGWFALLAFVALWGLHDVYLFYRARSDNYGPLLAHLAIYGLSLSYFINPRVKTLYFDPKLCWWKAKPRFETNLPLIVSDGRHFHYPILRNVSDGGCFIETPHPMEMNAKVNLTIPLPIPLNVPVIHSEGEVRWVSHNPLRPGMGVRFSSTSPAHRRAIRQYVRHQL